MFVRARKVAQGFAFLVCIGVGYDSVQARTVVEGRLIADQRGRISVEMTGERSQRVKDLLARVGDRVKKGDLLARLDTELLEADRVIAQRAFEEAVASVEVAKSNLAMAQLKYERRAGLKKSPSFNRAAFEDAEVELRAAKSRVQSAQSSASRRKAEVTRIDLEIKLAEIKAPYDGVVLDVLTSVGASVTQRAPNLFTLLNLSEIEIAVPVPRDQVQHLKPGQSVGYSLVDGAKRKARVRVVLPPRGPQQTAPEARLQLDVGDLPLIVRDRQAAKVYLGE